MNKDYQRDAEVGIKMFAWLISFHEALTSSKPDSEMTPEQVAERKRVIDHLCGAVEPDVVKRAYETWQNGFDIAEGWDALDAYAQMVWRKVVISVLFPGTCGERWDLIRVDGEAQEKQSLEARVKDLERRLDEMVRKAASYPKGLRR